MDPQESPGEIKSREVELGSESWTTRSLQLFLNSSATDIVFVTAPYSSETATAWYTSIATQWRGDTALTIFVVLAAGHGPLGLQKKVSLSQSE